jgi:hypothetical protein
MSKTLSTLFLKGDTGDHDVYTVNQTPRATRYGTTHTYSHHKVGPCLEVRRVSVTNWLGQTLQFLSSSPACSLCYVHNPNRLLAMLASWEN